MRFGALIVSAAILLLLGNDLPAREPDPALGGKTSVPHTGMNAFAQPAANLTESELRQFFVGNSFFKRNWVQAPASAAARDGLGPRFNARSCSACHLLDGRGGSPFSSGSGFVVRIDQNSGDRGIGGQLQNMAVSGVAPEGRLVIDRGTVPQHPDDYLLADSRPGFRIHLHQGDGEPATTIDKVSIRIGPQLVGLGLLEAIPEREIISGADADDEDGDGISGRVNHVLDHRADRKVPGRFGWKAGMPDVANQVAMALWQDMGITNPLHRNPNCNRSDADCTASPSGGAPEIDGELFEALVFYTRTLAPPIARTSENFAAGFGVFRDTGCADCHRPHWRTAGEFEIAALEDQSVWPFTDLLLHDMGPQLADAVGEGQAAGSEWRTPPLWGLGSVNELNPETGFLHDGRAGTIEQAILWHGGEASRARTRFLELHSRDKAWLIEFLESL